MNVMKKPQRPADMNNPAHIRQLAVERIDARLGAGYADSHPELLDTIMNTIAQDMAQDRDMQAYFNPGEKRPTYGIGAFAKLMSDTDRALENYVLERFNPSGRAQ
jgi:hypothetical protein